MNYLKAVKNLLLIVFIGLQSVYVAADMKPYTAIYDVYTKGFHIGEATQTLEKTDNDWIITLVIKPQGLAQFLQSTPSIQEQRFIIKHQPILLSAKSDSGKSGKDAKSSAYYDQNSKQIFMKLGGNSTRTPLKNPLSSYLLLPITAAAMSKSDQPMNITFYDKGKIKQRTMALTDIQSHSKTIDIYRKNSSEKLRYTFKTNNMQVPFRIEKIKNKTIKSYLELNSFSN